MKNYFTIFILMAVVVSCGAPPTPKPVDMPSQAQASNPQTPLDVPDWFMMTPEEDDEYIYATGEATSRKLSLAIQKASQQARMNLGQQISTKVQSLIESMTQEAGMDENTQITEFYSEAARSISNETLNGATVLKKYPYQTSNGGYRAYVLMGLKKNAFNNATVSAIKNEEAMFAEFKKTQVFQRMEEALGE
jgi:folate-dependent tRNA-U54 methylase TrmFO/GidA